MKVKTHPCYVAGSCFGLDMLVLYSLTYIKDEGSMEDITVEKELGMEKKV